MDGSLLEISDSSDEEGDGFIQNLQIMRSRNNNNTGTSFAGTNSTTDGTTYSRYPHDNVPRSGIPGRNYAGLGIPGQSDLVPSIAGPRIPPSIYAEIFAEPKFLNPNQPDPNRENVTHFREELRSRGMQVVDSIGMRSPGARGIMDHLNQVVDENPIRIARFAEQIRQRRNEIPFQDASANQHGREVELLNAMYQSRSRISDLLSRVNLEIWKEKDSRKRRRDINFELDIRLLDRPKRRNILQDSARGAEDPQPSIPRAVPGPAAILREHMRALAQEQNTDETRTVRAAHPGPRSVQSERRRGPHPVPRPAEPSHAPDLESAARTNAQYEGAADPQPSTSGAVPSPALSLRERITRAIDHVQGINNIQEVTAAQPGLRSVQSEKRRGARPVPRPAGPSHVLDKGGMVAVNASLVEQVIAAVLDMQPQLEQRQPHGQPPERRQPQQEQQLLERQAPEHQPQPQPQPLEQQQPQQEQDQLRGQPQEQHQQGQQPPQEQQPNAVVKDGKAPAPTEVSPLCLKLNQSLLTLLECPVCLEWMDPPMAQCRRGHLICQVCRTRMLRCPVCRAAFTSVRNRAMEQVAEKLRFPCRYACDAMVLLRVRARHEADCPRRLYSCPMPGCASSPHSPPVPYAVLKAHHLKTHAELIIIEDKRNFNVMPEVNENRDWIMFSHRQMFHIKFSNDDRNWGINCSVTYIGPKSNARKYLYKVKLSARNGVRKHSFTRETHHDLDLKRADSFHVPIEQGEQFKQNHRSVLQFTVSVKVNPNARVENIDETP